MVTKTPFGRATEEIPADLRITGVSEKAALQVREIPITEKNT